MSWQPNQKDVYHRLPEGGLLLKATKKVVSMNRGAFPQEMKDENGIYAKIFPHFILVAKKEPYGNIVSIHRTAVKRADELKRPVVMWLESTQAFYEFNPVEIIEEKEFDNEKGNADMYNFKISLGKRVWS